MSSDEERNLRWHGGQVSREQRAELLGHKAACIWLTGLSGSGKSTLARRLEDVLVSSGVHAYVLDGDNLRMGLNRDLGFSAADRRENIRRVSELARLLVDSGTIVICAFISPFRADRAAARELLGEDFIEVFVDARLEVCEERDPKNLYQRARSGEIEEFTGISSPYEEPTSAELWLDTATESVGACTNQVLVFLHGRDLITYSP
jgi:adenylylsulfate kinase